MYLLCCVCGNHLLYSIHPFSSITLRQKMLQSISFCSVEMYPAVSAQSTICINLFYNKKETKIFNFIRVWQKSAGITTNRL